MSCFADARFHTAACLAWLQASDVIDVSQELKELRRAAAGNPQKYPWLGHVAGEDEPAGKIDTGNWMEQRQ